MRGKYGEWLRVVSTRFNPKARSSVKRDVSSSSNIQSKVLGVKGHGRVESGRTDKGVTNEIIKSEKKIEEQLEEASILVMCRDRGIGELEPNQKVLGGLRELKAQLRVLAPQRRVRGELYMQKETY